MRRSGLLLLLLMVVPAAAQAPQGDTTAGAVPALQVSDFQNMLGADTHLPYTDGGYANIDNVLADLDYLGFHQVRDAALSPGVNGAAPLAAYERLARAGIRFAMVLDWNKPFATAGGTADNPSLDMMLGHLDTLERAAPGSILAVEGPNEINNQPIIFNGIGNAHPQDAEAGAAELQAALLFQRTLFAAVRADPLLSGVPVYYFTGYAAGSIGPGPDPLRQPGLADFNNQHPYPHNAAPPSAWVARARAFPNQRSEARSPAVFTETGYTSSDRQFPGWTADGQMKYGLDLLLDCFAERISKVFWYELIDAYAPGSPQGDDAWGLFDSANRPKPLATALHNLHTILADTDSAPTGPPPPTISTEGETPAGHHLLMQGSRANWWMAIWDETPFLDEAGRAVHITPHTVHLRLPETWQMTLYDPTLSSEPVARVTDREMAIEVSDHPVIVQITPKR